jgi:hypothetical protein
VLLLLALGGCDGVFGLRELPAPHADAPVDVAANDAADAMTVDYAPVVLADQPVGYYRLGETSGVVAVNQVRADLPGTFVGTVMLGAPGAVPGDPDTAVAFSYATPGGVDVGDVYDFPVMAPFSIEAWIEPAPDDGHSHIIVSKWHQPTNNFGYELFLQGETVRFSRELPTAADVVSASGIVAGQYTHVVGTFDGTSLRLYVNGTRQAIAAATVSLADDNNSFEIGTGGNAPFNGVIDEVAIYDKELPAARVYAHYMAAQ